MNNTILVGGTGFVGGNLLASGNFTASYHSTDVQNAFGSNPDLLIYSGVPAAMFLANQNPKADLDIMRSARDNIKKINAKKTVLISSICVFADSKGKTELDTPTAENLPAYGANRLQLEQWVREDFTDALIVRLPALYGIGLKKNFLYDLHTITPALLKETKYLELSVKSELVKYGYENANNGFYRLSGAVNTIDLRSFFEQNDFNALCFTDSRSSYQFYDLRKLWQDINTALQNNLKILHLATPPCTAKEIFAHVTSKNTFNNTLSTAPFDYNLKTNYSDLFNGENGYLCTKEQELDSIKSFMQNWD